MPERDPEAQAAGAAASVNVVVLSSLFPSATQPGAGLFIRERMFRVGRGLPLAVVAPQPWFPLQSLLRRWKPGFRPGAPAHEVQSGHDVWFPRFVSLPGVLKRFDGVAMALGALPRLLALKRAGRLDHIDAHFGYPDGRAATLLGGWLGVPVTVTLRGTETRHAADPVLAQPLRRALQSATRVFAVSQSLARVAAGLGVGGVRVIGNGVDTGVFAPMDRAAARRALGIDRAAPVLVSVGGLVERKGFHRVIACLPALRQRHPGLQYLVVGGASAEGDMRRELEAQVAAAGLQDCVRFLGTLPPSQLRQPLSAADVFVLATRNEGWANVFLEAMACGLPVVSTDVGGNAEVVSSPALGRIVPFGDAAALQAAIDAALRMPWDRAAIRAHAAANTWDARVRDVTAELLAIAQARSQAAPKRSLATRLVAGVLFPLQERAKRHTTLAVHRSLDATQWLPPDALAALQRDRLRALLVNVGRHVPYYRDAFARLGFDPAAVTSLADLQQLPFLTKPLIRAHSDALKNDRAEGLARFNTGGSSGEPLVFWIGRERVSHDVAAKWRATRWWGVDIGDRETVVWGSPIELGSQDRLRLWRDRLFRTRLLPAFEMSDARLDTFVAAIRAQRPKMLFGYPSALTHIARHAERRGVRLDDIGVEVAFVTSERLYDEQRAAIARAFGCRVANGYGGRDAGFIAHECPAGSLHVTAEDVVVEIVDAGGRVLPPGQSGEIVVTHLATRDFPFIRYRTGDVGTLGTSPCTCGRGLPVLADIQGRSTDFVVAADGTVLHGLALVYVVRDLPGVRAFKVVQETLARTRVQLVTDTGFDERHVATIVSGFRRRLGPGVQVDVERVAEIAPERSGKFRYIVSHVDAGAGAPSRRAETSDA